ncbi:MAG: copper-binding protein [Variovorax sp.]|nr:MAG: copper-binding protein [Variovorax sp.]
MKLRSILITLSLLALAAAQAQTSPGATSAPSKASKDKAAAAMPLTEGEVERVDKERNEVVLNHGDLPNLGMPAMTMAFNVADKRMLDSLKRGDKVRFNAEIIKGEATVTYIEAAP